MEAQNIPSTPPLSPHHSHTLSPNTTSTTPPISPPSASRPTISLQQPSNKKGPSKSSKIFRRFRSVFRSFPIITPVCKIPVSLHGTRLHDNHIHGGTRMTGTLFGYRKARVNLAIQENSKCLPILVLELAITTGKLLQEMGLGLVRIALECEKRPSEKIKILDEPIWTLFCNGRKSGYGVRREPTDEDLMVMQTLHPISMGAGVIPTEATENPDGELTYMRAHFERVVNSRDSETYYMMNPDGNSGPELSIFFVRIG
ncbi:protein MIZU-KUSSEI 1 [Durio zibethinus]|uniref:Protein MIZU-KUSSEI 1 n=1 Tax=Durio zibethinus TaxID=66656 RepID=A0A6P6AIQ1_DURZI|nr:protein MIZU-KUSSEI 1 [Durio zibethinus]